MPAVTQGPGGSGSNSTIDYIPVSFIRTSRVNSDETVENIIQATQKSAIYGVTFTFFIASDQWEGGQGNGLIEYMTEVVNNVCAYQHVIGFRTVQDQDPSRLLVNYGVIAVGTPDGAFYDE